MTKSQNTNDQPTVQEAFAKTFADLIEDARQRGIPPSSPESVVAGLELVSNLYTSHSASETNARLCLGLIEVLFYNFSEFGSAFIAVAKALDSQDDTNPSQVAALLDRIGLEATHGDARQAVAAEQRQ